MNSKTFKQRVKQYESILDEYVQNKTTWIENDWFLIEPLNENDSEISIRFSFDEIRVGIGMVTEYYSDEYEGMEYEKGFSKFIELLSTTIKRKDYFKGKSRFKSHYTYLKNENYKLFGTEMIWAFKFWKTTTTEINIQNPIIESEIIKKLLNERK